MLGSSRSSSGEQGIPFAAFAFVCPVFPSSPPPPLGDEYTYHRPPSEDPSPFPSPPPSVLDCATLLVLKLATISELPAPPATPSILVSTNFNTPRGLGADAHPSNVAEVEGISSAPPSHPSRCRAAT